MTKISKIAAKLATKFTPKFATKVGMLITQKISVAQLICLFSNTSYIYDGQRDSEKNTAKRGHVQGVLSGGSQQFSGVYCEELKAYFNMDGYHRAQAITVGTAKFAPGCEIELTVHRVKTKEDMELLYDQFNSPESTKKAPCYFESGMRKAKLTEKLKSIWVLGSGKAKGVQYAAGVRGTKSTRLAVVKMAKGLLFCDSLDLPRTRHIVVGMKGAIIAIAQYSPNARLAEYFIERICRVIFEPTDLTASELVIFEFHNNLLTNQFGGHTGGSSNDIKLDCALAAFYKYACAVRGYKSKNYNGRMTLAQFITEMENFGK
jgi:hypothetical protein